MNFLVDAQLTPMLAAWLRDQGLEAQHLHELGLASATDHEVWARALANNQVVITKDRDFVEWAIVRDPAPQVVWLRIGNLGNRVLIARLESSWGRIQAELISGVRVVEAGRS